MEIGRIYRPNEKVKQKFCDYYGFDVQAEYCVCLLKYIKSTDECFVAISRHHNSPGSILCTTQEKYVTVSLDTEFFWKCKSQQLIRDKYIIQKSDVERLRNHMQQWRLREWKIQRYLETKPPKTKKVKVYRADPLSRTKYNYLLRPPKKPVNRIWIHSKYWQGGAPQ